MPRLLVIGTASIHTFLVHTHHVIGTLFFESITLIVLLVQNPFLHPLMLLVKTHHDDIGTDFTYLEAFKSTVIDTYSVPISGITCTVIGTESIPLLMLLVQIDNAISRQ